MNDLGLQRRVIVSLKGGGYARGIIVEILEKHYRVLLDGKTEPELFQKRKVRPESSRPPTPPLSPLKVEVTPWPVPILTIEARDLAPPRAIPKPTPPEECKPWLAFVHRQPCCNCGSSFNVEAHHEGKKGHAQKVRDTMSVPLCQKCHTVYTLENALPDPEATRQAGELRLRTRKASLEILRNAQEHLLQLALAQLEQRDRIEVLSKGIANILRPGALAPLLERIDEPCILPPKTFTPAGETQP